VQYIKIIILFAGLFLINELSYGKIHTDFINQGKTYLMELDLDRAIYSFSKAIEFDQNNVDAYLNRARAYLLNNNADKASADYRKASELDPEYVKRRLNIRINTGQNNIPEGDLIND
jgi:Flp pilus assembly protein TadD